MAIGKVCIYTESPTRQDTAPTLRKCGVHLFAELRHRRIDFLIILTDGFGGVAIEIYRYATNYICLSASVITIAVVFC